MRKPSFCVRGVCTPDLFRPTVGCRAKKGVREKIRFAMLIVRYNIINGIERFRA